MNSAEEPASPLRPVDASRVRKVPAGWRLFVIVGSLSIFGPLCIDMYLPALPEIGRQLHAGASAVQLTITACLIGISCGQLVFGSVSDRYGRRAPLLAGIGAFIGSSIACAFAPNVYLLALFRLIQGLGGAAGIVIARSIVRDLRSGVALIRFFSTLMLITGLGPVLAPQIGAEVLQFTTWRGVFVILAAVGSALLVTTWWRVPETLAPELRQSGGIATTVRVMATVGRDRVFLGSALAVGLGMSATFAYISGSSFALQNVYGLSPLRYGVVFALNACGMVAGAQLNGRLAARFGPSRLLIFGLGIMTTGAAALVFFVVSRVVGLQGVIPALFLVMFGCGYVGPNGIAIAMQRYPQSAGVAAAVLGSFQFIVGSAIAPLAGIGGTHDALPMAVLMLILPAAAIASKTLLARSTAPPAEPATAAAVLAPGDGGQRRLLLATDAATERNR